MSCLQAMAPLLKLAASCVVAGQPGVTTQLFAFTPIRGPGFIELLGETCGFFSMGPAFFFWMGSNHFELPHTFLDLLLGEGTRFGDPAGIGWKFYVDIFGSTFRDGCNMFGLVFNTGEFSGKFITSTLYYRQPNIEVRGVTNLDRISSIWWGYFSKYPDPRSGWSVRKWT